MDLHFDGPSGFILDIKLRHLYRPANHPPYYIWLLKYFLDGEVRHHHQCETVEIVAEPSGLEHHC